MSNKGKHYNQGKNNPMFGKRGLRPKGIPCSKETKIKIGNSNRGNFKTIEERTRISNTLKRKLLSGEIIHPRGFLGKKHKNKLQLYRKHLQRLHIIAENLIEEGFEILLPDKLRPDIIVRKDSKLYSIELENKKDNRHIKRITDKYDKIPKFFNKIIMITPEESVERLIEVLNSGE